MISFVSRIAVRPPAAARLFALLALLPLPALSPAQKPPSQVPPAIQQIQALIQQGHLDEARAMVLKDLDRHPSSVESLNLLGIIETSRQDYASALAAFQKALRLSPNFTRTLNNLGNLYVVEKMPAQAEKEFRAVLRLDPANSDANYNLGLLLMSKGAPTEAIPHFERVRPQSVQTRFNLIRAYFQSKRSADAMRVAAEVSASNKNDVQVHFSLGLLLASEKQYSAAGDELEKADALEPETFEILFNLGQVLIRNTQYPRAELVLNRALKLKPDSPETMYLLAQAAMNQSHPLDALDLLVRAHQLAPENTDVIFLMALVSMSQNYFEDAIPLLESGVQLAPKRSDLVAALGESYFMSGKADKAVEAFKKLVALDESARSYAFLGLSYRNLGRFDEAKEYFAKGLKLDPRNTSCLFNLGFIAERQGDSAAAESMFQEALRVNPDFPDALLELANLRMAAARRPEAAELLRKFVKVSPDPATGYYKLATVERGMHDLAAAERDLNVFKSLSKNASAGPYPYEHLFDYLDNRSRLAPGARNQLDLAELEEQIKKHPGLPENLYMLAEAYLKAGRPDDARSTIEQLDKLSAGDFRTLTGVGVLLARYRMYQDAIEHFELALKANPGSDEVKFDLANALFHKQLYPQALEVAEQLSPEGRNDDASLALLGDIYAHLGQNDRAAQIFEDAVKRNPDNDQGYLSLALLHLRQNNVAAAREILRKGASRIPLSGKLFWGQGLASALDGKTAQAAGQLERAVELLPEWSGGYSTLGVFYFQTGQIDKAREVLNRFRSSTVSASLDVDRIAQVLDRAPAAVPHPNDPIAEPSRSQLLEFALSLADRTL